MLCLDYAYGYVLVNNSVPLLTGWGILPKSVYEPILYLIVFFE